MPLSPQRVNKIDGEKGHTSDVTNFFKRMVHWLLNDLYEHSLTKEAKLFFYREVCYQTVSQLRRTFPFPIQFSIYDTFPPLFNTTQHAV